MATTRFDSPSSVPTPPGRTAALGRTMSPDEFRDLANNRRLALALALQYIEQQGKRIEPDKVVDIAATFHSFLNGDIITTSDGQAISTS